MASNRSNSDLLVIDASLVLRLILNNPVQATVQGHFQRWLNNGHSLIAPTLWVYEITSAINKGVHFGQILQGEGEEALRQTLSLDIDLIAPSERLARAAFAWTTKLRRASAYDSFYLALADEHDAPLWTADGKLVRSVNLDWVRLGTE